MDYICLQLFCGPLTPVGKPVGQALLRVSPGDRNSQDWEPGEGRKCGFAVEGPKFNLL